MNDLFANCNESWKIVVAYAEIRSLCGVGGLDNEPPITIAFKNVPKMIHYDSGPQRSQ